MSPDPVQIAAMLGAAAFLLGLVNGTLKLVDRLKGRPPAGELQNALESLSRRVSAVEEGQKEIRTEGDERRRAIYEKIEETRLELKEDIGNVENRIVDMPSQIVALLRNVGAIRGPRP